MPTTTPKLGLPRPIESDTVTLVNQHALIDAIDNGAAPITSPTFLGIPKAPTAAAGTNTDQIATMKALKAAVDAIPAPTAPTWTNITGKPSTFPPDAHNHSAAEIVESAAKQFVSATEKTTWNTHATRTDNPHGTTAAQVGASPLGHTHTGAAIDAPRGDMSKDLVTAQELRWKNFGNNHTIIEASAGNYPGGNTNAQAGWQPSYPTLMGYNGSQTFGVRVDSARTADQVGGVQFRLNSGNIEFYNGSIWQGAGGIKGVQRGITGTADTTVTISAVNMSKSFVTFNNFGSMRSDTYAPYRAVLTSPTTLAIGNAAGNTGNGNLAWEVVEFY